MSAESPPKAAIAWNVCVCARRLGARIHFTCKKIRGQFQNLSKLNKKNFHRQISNFPEANEKKISAIKFQNLSKLSKKIPQSNFKTFPN